MRRVVIDMPAASAGSRLESPGRRAAKLNRAETHQTEVRARSRVEVQGDVERRLVERKQAWADPEHPGRDPFLVERQDGSLTPNRGPLAYEHKETPGSLRGLHVEKRAAKS